MRVQKLAILIWLISLCYQYGSYTCSNHNTQHITTQHNTTQHTTTIMNRCHPILQQLCPLSPWVGQRCPQNLGTIIPHESIATLLMSPPGVLEGVVLRAPEYGGDVIEGVASNWDCMLYSNPPVTGGQDTDTSARWRFHNRCSWLLCLGCQNTTHQEKERGAGPMP